MLPLDAQPSGAHRYLAALEQSGRDLAVVTQNIDGLHQKAGSRRVYELHGSIYRNPLPAMRAFRCARADSGQRGRAALSPLRRTHQADVVLYGEPLDEAVLRAAIDAIARARPAHRRRHVADRLSGGGLLDEFRGDSLVVINRTPTAADHRADLLISEPIGEVLQSLIPHIPAPPRGKSRP